MLKSDKYIYKTAIIRYNSYMEFDFCISNDPKEVLALSLKTIYFLQADRSYDVQSYNHLSDSTIALRTLSGNGKIIVDGHDEKVLYANTLIFIKYNDVLRYYCSDEKWNFWTFKSQIKYPNAAALTNKIQTELADLVETREALDNHIKFIDKTLSTVDNLIYAIPKRIEIEQITRGK